MKKVLITGGNGYIAKNIYQKFKDKHGIHRLTREDVDLTDPKSVFDWFKGKSFDVVIHTATVGGRRTNVQNSGKPTPSESEVLDQNLLMYYNLLECKPFYNRFIQLGSGIEGSDDLGDPYALSKTVISNSITGKSNFYNIRIFAVFDENEQNDRFIKSNLIRYINKENIALHCDKKMDFFYMQDLLKLVEHYIDNNRPPKQIDCTYKETKSLHEIADFINSLGEHKVKIDTPKGIWGGYEDYCGEHIDLGLNYIGLEQGIRRVYEKGFNSYWGK